MHQNTKNHNFPYLLQISEDNFDSFCTIILAFILPWVPVLYPMDNQSTNKKEQIPQDKTHYEVRTLL